MARKVFPGFLIAVLLFSVTSLWAAPAVPGGILKVGSQPIGNLDPHFATSIADITLLEQVYQHLTFIDPSNRPVPDLATKWQSADGKVWVFTLQRRRQDSTTGSPSPWMT